MGPKKKTYEIQWEGDGNRRVETVEAHDYRTGTEPIPTLLVYNYPKTETDDERKVFELIGHPFAILNIDEEE